VRSEESTKKTILVAEDNPVNRELIRELLELRGYSVIEASDGKEAFEKIHQHSPDLVLADIQMPEMSGFDLVDKVRSDKTFADLPVIALTAYAMWGDREKTERSGFSGYVSKPFNSATFFAEISRCLAPKSAA
jgi:two-component system cell cycle response regulator DivK